MVNKDNNFKLYNKIIRYDMYLRKYVTTMIPNVYRDLRIRYLYESLYTKGNIRLKNINEMIVTISMIDFICTELSEVCKDNKKHIETSIGMLTEIKNMIYAWRNKINLNEKRDV